MRAWNENVRAGRLLSALFAAAFWLVPVTARAGDDADGDTVPDLQDNCPTVPNLDQLDGDGDAVGDVCDNCKLNANHDQANNDQGKPGGDAKGDVCDPDDDADNIGDDVDNCDFTANYDQANNDEDALGDACDEDDDNDQIPDDVDNCPFAANSEQADFDLDGIGDACDEDNDNDGLYNGLEDALGLDPLSPDTDGDGINDGDEMCAANVGCDKDQDGVLDALEADSDYDGDGVKDSEEAGDTDTFTDPVDTDADGVPDFQDTDSDEDGIKDSEDKCLGDICKLGGTCATAIDCASGNCVNGICCDAACDGLCETCGGDGKCGLQPAGFNPFKNDSCVGDIVVGVGCTEAGELEAKKSENCAPFVCVKGACTSECAGDEDCSEALGYCTADKTCQAKKPDNTPCERSEECLTAVCILGVCGVTGEATCAADGVTFVDADGKTTKDCSPYACREPSGVPQCVDTCETVADCAPPYVCSLDHQCVARPDVTAEAACALPASQSTGHALAALLVLPLVVAIRRRRRRAASARALPQKS